MNKVDSSHTPASETILFPDEVILTTDTFVVGQDWEVPIPAFFIIGSKDSNKRSVLDFSDDELIELVLTIKKVRSAMLKVLNIRDVYLFQNEDTDHGFHVWLFPRHTWMKEFGRKIQSVRPIMNYAKENMIDEVNVKEVREIAQKMQVYLS